MTRTPKRRRRRPFATLVRRFWLLGAVLIAVATWGVWRIAALPAFRLSSLAISSLPHVPRERISAAARIDARANVWLLDRRAIARRIEAIPYVDRARVLVRPPGAVTLDVSERAIAGCVRDSLQRAYTIDATRRVLAQDCDPAAPVAYELATPLDTRPGAVITAPELAVLMSDGRALANSGQVYGALRHDALGELEATLRSGVMVRFGEESDLDRKERLVGPIIAELAGQRRSVRALDVRAASTPVVEFRPPAKPRAQHLDKL